MMESDAWSDGRGDGKRCCRFCAIDYNWNYAISDFLEEIIGDIKRRRTKVAIRKLKGMRMALEEWGWLGRKA